LSSKPSSVIDYAKSKRTSKFVKVSKKQSRPLFSEQKYAQNTSAFTRKLLKPAYSFQTWLLVPYCSS